MKKFKDAPIELKIFILFSLTVSIVSYLLPRVSRTSYEKVIPFTGWSLGSPYMTLLFLSIFCIYFYSKITLISLKFMVLVSFINQIYYGYQGIKLGGGENYNNPYLMVSDYRYVWAYVIPILWISMFVFSPNLKIKTNENLLDTNKK